MSQAGLHLRAAAAFDCIIGTVERGASAFLESAVPQPMERGPSAVMDAMLGMEKIDVEQLRRASMGGG